MAFVDDSFEVGKLIDCGDRDRAGVTIRQSYSCGFELRAEAMSYHLGFVDRVDEEV